jgi:hypothetical protein
VDKETTQVAAPVETLVLKSPLVAGLMTWLIPGWGQWFQGRYVKAVIYFVCILGTYIYGLYLGDGRVVYMQWRSGDPRLHFVAQASVGVFALPALVQAERFKNPDLREAARVREQQGQRGISDWLFVPPEVHSDPRRTANDESDELDRLNKRLNRYFELGTAYTVIAGLLNVLAIFDAIAGPAYGLRWLRVRDEPDTP